MGSFTPFQQFVSLPYLNCKSIFRIFNTQLGLTNKCLIFKIRKIGDLILILLIQNLELGTYVVSCGPYGR